MDVRRLLMAGVAAGVLAGCGSVYHAARGMLPPQPADRVAMREQAAREAEDRAIEEARVLREMLKGPAWADRVIDQADRVDLAAWELERAALAVEDARAGGGVSGEADHQPRRLSLARALRSATARARDGGPAQGRIALDEAMQAHAGD
jgi:hypothetical protein